jgi:hypothetical protein
VYRLVERALLAAAVAFSDFRLVEFSVQRDHLHLIVEAQNKTALTRGMRGLSIRVAKAHNRALRTHGVVLGDRYHARELTTPMEVKNALLYVLNNARKHGTWMHKSCDPCSSGKWFGGWKDLAPAAASPLSPGKTWLLTIGWRRRGLLVAGAAPHRPTAPDRFLEPELIPIDIMPS